MATSDPVPACQWKPDASALRKYELDLENVVSIFVCFWVVSIDSPAVLKYECVPLAIASWHLKFPGTLRSEQSDAYKAKTSLFVGVLFHVIPVWNRILVLK